jgi:hypothetical protein
LDTLETQHTALLKTKLQLVQQQQQEEESPRSPFSPTLNSDDDKVCSRCLKYSKDLKRLEDIIETYKNKCNTLEISLSTTKSKAMDSKRLIEKNEMEYKINFSNTKKEHELFISTLRKEKQNEIEIINEKHDKRDIEVKIEISKLENRLKDAVQLSNRQTEQLDRLSSTLSIEKYAALYFINVRFSIFIKKVSPPFPPSPPTFCSFIVQG